MKRTLYFGALLGFPIGMIFVGIFRSLEHAFYYSLVFGIPFYYFMYGMWIHVPNPKKRGQASKEAKP